MHRLLFAGMYSLDICIPSGFPSTISLTLSFLFRVLGKQLLLPKDEGFQHFQSRNDSMDTKCLPGLHECTSNIKEYVNFFKLSFWSSSSEICANITFVLLNHFSVIKYALSSFFEYLVLILFMFFSGSAFQALS